jgi:hypothetical protein
MRKLENSNFVPTFQFPGKMSLHLSRAAENLLANMQQPSSCPIQYRRRYPQLFTQTKERAPLTPVVWLSPPQHT